MYLVSSITVFLQGLGQQKPAKFKLDPQCLDNLVGKVGGQEFEDVGLEVVPEAGLRVDGPEVLLQLCFILGHFDLAEDAGVVPLLNAPIDIRVPFQLHVVLGPEVRGKGTLAVGFEVFADGADVVVLRVHPLCKHLLELFGRTLLLQQGRHGLITTPGAVRPLDLGRFWPGPTRSLG